MAPVLCEHLEAMNFNAPTRIQQATLPVLLVGSLAPPLCPPCNCNISGVWMVLCQHAPRLNLTISVAVLYKFAQIMSAALLQASICACHAVRMHINCVGSASMAFYFFIHKKKWGKVSSMCGYAMLWGLTWGFCHAGRQRCLGKGTNRLWKDFGISGSYHPRLAVPRAPPEQG